jgi:D-3-phosphoglycerate dehydrogenase / 2-oxoglutarate reductase
MKVLLADKFQQSGIDAMTVAGFEVVSKPGLSAADLPAALKESDPDVLVVRSTKVSAEALDSTGRLKLIVRAGAGYDTIDVDHASDNGVFVANCPGKNAIAVAELAWSLILSCDRRIPDQTSDIRNGKWNKKKYGKARGLYGRTLGLIGFGTIAQEVATRARAFGMKVAVWSRSMTAAKARAQSLEFAPTPVELALQSDVVSVHVASNAETKHLINEGFVNAMRDGAYLVNTSRGAVVDEAALRKGIESKGLRAGLDVFESEPGSGVADYDKAIAKDPGVYCSHHVGASTDQAQEAIADEAVRVICQFNDSGEVLNCVNLATKSAAVCLLTVRHHNKPGVLGKVAGLLGEAGINVEEMENILYQGAKTACARIPLASEPTSEHLKQIQESSNAILSLELSPLN